MEFLFVLAPFVVGGLVVIYMAFWGGTDPKAREAYLRRARGRFTFGMIALYIVLAGVVPAAVISLRPEAEGATGSLRTEEISGQKEEGKHLFIQTCKSCHTLAAVNAHGVTGPNLDQLTGLDKQRVMNAIKRGGTGTGRMPPGLLAGRDAEAVATYVAAVAGR